MPSISVPDEKANLQTFVEMIIGDSEAGYVEIRTLRQTPGDFGSYGSEFVAVREPNGLAVVEVVTRKDQLVDALTCIAPAIRKATGSGKAAVKEINVLWVDMDFKQFDDGEADAKASILAFPFQPHCIVRSGHGFHCYWRLKEPWVLDDKAEQDQASGILRRMAKALGGDLAPAQLAAVLRAPGTWNRKDPKNPVQTRITRWESDYVSPMELDDFLPADEHADLGDISEPQGQLMEAWDDAQPPSVVIDTLRVTGQTLAIIKYGVPVGSDPSAVAMSIITALLRSEYDPETIRAVFQATPTGIGAGYDRRGRDGDRWLALSIVKAQAWMDQQLTAPAASPGRVEPAPSPNEEAWKPENIDVALSRDVPPPPMLVDGLLREGDLSAIVADSGVAKSWLAEILGFHFASGTRLWNRDVKGPMKVLFIQEEMSDADTIDRLRKIRKTMPLSDDEIAGLTFTHLYQPGLTLSDPAPLVALLTENQYDIVFIDSFSAVRGSVEENDNDGVGRLLQTIKQQICVRFGCHVVFIHHTRKPDAKGNIDPMYAARGASAFKAWVDNMWVLVRNPENDWLKFYVAKSRGFKQPEGFLLMRLRDTDEGGVEIILADPRADKKLEPMLTVTDRVRNFITQQLERDKSVSLSFVVEMVLAETGATRESVVTAIHTLSQMDMCSWIIEKQMIVDRATLLELERKGTQG